MSETLAPPRITPEDMLRMPDEGRGYELVDGELVEVRVSTESSRAGVRFARFLDVYCDQAGIGWVFGSDQGFQCFADAPEKVRRADAAYVSLKRMPVEAYVDEGYCTVVPDLVVEAVSLHDTARDVDVKTQDWLNAGTTLVWVVYPTRQVIQAHRMSGPIQVFRTADVLTAEDVLPGFAVPVVELFRKPGKQS